MIIKSIYVSSFGKLKNYSLELNDGLNSIQENNGWGKSTIAVFIKSMFYGLNDSKRSIEENERLKFRPWNSTEKFGGNLVFVWKEKEYKIERFFGQKSSEDTVKLYDNQTGREFFKTETLGERIFQIDEEGFFSTTFFSQKDLEVKSNSSLTSKYSAVLDSEDTQKFDKIIEKIENKAKEYKARGDKGLIFQTKKEIIELDAKIEQAKKSKQILSSLEEELRLYENQASTLKNDVENVNDKLLALAKSKTYEYKNTQISKLNAQIIENQKKISDFDFILNQKEISATEHELYVGCAGDYEKAKAIKNVLSEDVKKLKEPQKSQNNKLSIAFMALFITFLVVAVGAMFVSYLVGLILLTPTVIFLVLWLLGSRDGVKKSILTEKINELRKFTELTFSIEDKLNSYLSRFNTDDSLSFGERLTNVLNAYKEKTVLIGVNSELIKEISELKVDLIDKTITNFNESEVELTTKLTALKKSYADKLDLIALTKSKINHYSLITDSLEELNESKENTNEKLNDYVTHYNLLTKTLDFMKQADENMKVKYREPLKNAFSKYVSAVLGDKIVDIDVDFRVTVDENGQKRNTDFYSLGYKNVLNICKRFALIDVLFENEKPFIILDDPFVNLDQDKLDAVKKVLEILMNEYQILYFTCHNSREV